MRLLREVLAVGVEEFAFFIFLPVRLVAARRRLPWLFILRRQRFAGRIAAVIAGSAEKLVEKWERRGLRGVVVVFIVCVVILVLRVCHQPFQTVHRTEHFARNALQIFIGKTHTADHIVDRLDAKLLRALEAVALVDRLAVFNLRDEHHGKILFAFGT